MSLCEEGQRSRQSESGGRSARRWVVVEEDTGAFLLLNAVIEAEKGVISINHNRFELESMQIFARTQLSSSYAA